MDCPDIDDILDALEEKPRRIHLQTSKPTPKSGQYTDDVCDAEEQNGANYTYPESNAAILVLTLRMLIWNCMLGLE